MQPLISGIKRRSLERKGAQVFIWNVSCFRALEQFDTLQTWSSAHDSCIVQSLFAMPKPHIQWKYTKACACKNLHIKFSETLPFTAWVYLPISVQTCHITFFSDLHTTFCYQNIWRKQYCSQHSHRYYIYMSQPEATKLMHSVQLCTIAASTTLSTVTIAITLYRS